MKVFLIGGTGLLGSEAAKVLIERGHEVTSIALPPLPEGADLPKEMKIEFGNYLEMSDEELRDYLKGCDGFIFAAGVLELPYIFGTQPGRKPVWMFLAEQIRGSKGVTMYPKGGSAMVTVRQVGQALAGAMEHTQGGKCWPIGWYNKTWNEMIMIAHRALGCPDKKIINIPKWMFNLGTRSMYKKQLKNNIEGGLYLPKLSDIQCNTLYINKKLGCVPLGVTDDNIVAAITDSMKLCADILDGKSSSIGMKGE